MNFEISDATKPTETSTDLVKVSDSIMSTLATRRRQMYAHFDDFVQCYFAARAKDLYFGDKTVIPSPNSTTGITSTIPSTANTGGIDDCTAGTHLITGTSGLDTFRENLVKFSRYNSLRQLATLTYSSDLFNNSTIVSSIEFDKDNEFFAIAGVTKRIKVFDYGAVIHDTVDIHYPTVEMVSSSKISCISWNSYHKGTLASSDYEGRLINLKKHIYTR